SKGGSMGCGLGAVQRLMDGFDIHSRSENNGSGDNGREAAGTIVTVHKWLVRRKDSRPFICSGYSRPFPGHNANGDSYFISDENDDLLVAVADGLGHGPDAEAASKEAIEYIRNNRRKELDRIFPEIHEKLRKTRGAALTVVHLSCLDRSLAHTGIGNIEIRMFPRDHSMPVPQAGVLGVGTLPRIKVATFPFPKNGTLVMFSDGVSGRWDLDEKPELLRLHTTTLSHLLIRDYARPNNDATVVTVKEATNNTI
ncbi:MAG: SpoIIE family protein phosphatase, partial [Candidatus Krumholzibacteria bacterium]|nr:SpoIIE family protein phosphatase [Candidatus Krumholzibacteria bacterium]